MPPCLPVWGTCLPTSLCVVHASLRTYLRVYYISGCTMGVLYFRVYYTSGCTMVGILPVMYSGCTMVGIPQGGNLCAEWCLFSHGWWRPPTPALFPFHCWWRTPASSLIPVSLLVENSCLLVQQCFLWRVYASLITRFTVGRC